MQRIVSEFLSGLGFEVQNTSFGHLTDNDKLAYLKSIDLPENEAANILKCFPDLFVMHGEVKPNAGTFFVVCLEKNRNLTEQAQKIYKKFFPRKIMIVSGDSEKLYGKWFHTSARPEPLLDFIQKEIGLKKLKN